MEKFKGTRGKWEMTTSALECDHNSEIATIWGDSGYGEGATLIAHIDKGAGEKAMPNARLIAAAPELLEALQELMEGIEGLPPLTAIAGVLKTQYEKGRLVIKKALEE